jgi:hypothetical protein
VNEKDRWIGQRKEDSPNIKRVVEVGEISAVKASDVSDKEEAVLESGIIEQRYFVDKDNDGNYRERFASERSLDADGRYTNEIYERPE